MTTSASPLATRIAVIRPLAGERGPRGKARAQPFLVLQPQLVLRLSGDRHGVALHAIREEVAAVVFDVIHDRLWAVALPEEQEKIATVEVIAVVREAAPPRVD